MAMLRSKFSRASQVRASKEKTFGPSASVRLITKDSMQELAPIPKQVAANSRAMGGAAGWGRSSKEFQVMWRRSYLARARW